MISETDELARTAGTGGQAPSTEDCIEALVRVLPRITRAFKSQLRSSKLGTQHIFLLMTIADVEQVNDEGAQPGDLARRAWLSGAAITAALDDLVDEGYCVRAHSEIDRRKVLVRLTPEGHTVLNEVHAQAKQALRNVLGDWDEQRRAELCRVLHDLDGIGAVLLRPSHGCPERACTS